MINIVCAASLSCYLLSQQLIKKYAIKVQGVIFSAPSNVSHGAGAGTGNIMGK